MKSNFELSLAYVLKHEGGFVEHPKDPGGATNRGVTLKTYQKFYGPNMTVGMLKKINEEEVRHIYKTGFWDFTSCNELPSGIDYAVFDMAVNMGPERATTILQKVLQVEIDGDIGPKTLGASFERPVNWTLDRVEEERLAYYQTRDHWETFKNGWTNRSKEVTKLAKDLYLQEAISGPSMVTEKVIPNTSLWNHIKSLIGTLKE